MTGFSTSNLVFTELPDLAEELPYLFDDCSLAFFLRIRTKTLWWILRNTNLGYKMYTKRKKNGIRVIHSPTKAMKAILKRANARLLNPMQEQLGPHVTAYRPGHSVRDAVLQHIPPCPVCDISPLHITPPSHNCPRTGTCIQLDLKDFFPSTSRAWIRQYFTSLGYSHNVASYLAALFTVTNIPNPRYRTGKKFDPNIRKCFSGVPQGAPTSGAVCNLVADYRLDTPLLDLLQQWNHTLHLPPESEWVYTRYSDDITLTCSRQLPHEQRDQFITDVVRVIRQSGYQINSAKTRITNNARQRRYLLGMTFNHHPNYADKKYRRLRAIIHNCVKHGFATQHTKAGFKDIHQLCNWLRGTIGWVKQINPIKGQKLLDAFTLAIQTKNYAGGNND